MIVRNASAALMCLCGLAAVAADAPQREMNVQQGPEAVFERPIAELLPTLADARATGENGRIGNELVFWGYTLADGRTVNAFACAMLEGVDCEARSALICPTSDRMLERTQVEGRVRAISCRAVSVETPGAVRPGCDDREIDRLLEVGVIQCQ